MQYMYRAIKNDALLPPRLSEEDLLFLLTQSLWCRQEKLSFDLINLKEVFIFRLEVPPTKLGWEISFSRIALNNKAAPVFLVFVAAGSLLPYKLHHVWYTRLRVNLSKFSNECNTTNRPQCTDLCRFIQLAIYSHHGDFIPIDRLTKANH